MSKFDNKVFIRYILRTGKGAYMNVNFKHDIKPISYIKTNAAEMMKYVNDNRNPIMLVYNSFCKLG